MKCFKLGLRKQIKSLELFQAGVEEPSNKKEKRSLNDDQVEVDSAEENDDEIQYLLSSNTTNSIVEEDKETEPHLVKFIKEAIPSPSEGFPVAENNSKEITNTVIAKPESKDNIKTTYNENDIYDYVEQKHEAYKQVRSGELNINDVCLTCG
uniref:Uncharacterized protein n=1 Tax=Ciona savignyi TaxID=51511 RepID=H2YJ35_CIOSA